MGKNSNILPHEIEGNITSYNSENIQTLNSVLIFLHGWPDTLRLWDDVIQNISSQKEKNDIVNQEEKQKQQEHQHNKNNKNNQDFFVLNLSYPNFHKSESKILGQDFPVLVNRIHYSINKIIEQQLEKEGYTEKIPKIQKIIVAHDWGAYLAYQVDKKFPNFVDSMVCLDVSPTNDNYTIMQQMLIYLYQIQAIQTYFLGIFVPFLADFWAKHVVAKILAAYPYKKYEKNIQAKMGYMYFYLYKNMIKSKLGLEEHVLQNYKPSVPISYMYAKGKEFQFQSEGWLRKMAKDTNRLYPVNGGHWIQLRHSKKISEVIQERAKL